VYYVSNGRTIIYGSSSEANLLATTNAWALAFNGNSAGTYSGAGVNVIYNVDSAEQYLSSPAKATIIISSYGAATGFIEGSFSATQARHNGASPADTNTYQIINGSFRAYRLSDMP
jgi:hypothetical protein